MLDTNKTKEQLLNELAALRQRISELEKSESELKQTQERLRESEEKYRTLVEQANDGIAILQDRLLKYANPRTAKIIGYTADEITGTPFTEYIHPDELPNVVNHYKRRMAGEEVPSKYESIILHKDGHEVFIEINANLITYQGKPADLVIVRDITERKLAEEALRRSEERYRSLVENTEDPIYLVDKDSRYLFMNKKNLSRLRLALDQVIGKTYSKFHSKEETEIFEKCIKSVFKTRKSLTREHKSQRDGRFFLRTYSPVKDDKGKVEAVTVISKDITGLKKTEDALKESEMLYRELVEKAGIAILIDDREGNFTYFNKKYAELFGYSEEEMKKQSIQTVVHPDDVDRVMRFHENRIQGKKAPPRYEFKGIKKDGSTIYLEVNAVKLKEGKKTVGSRSYVWDITERKQAEHLMHIQHELGLALSGVSRIDETLRLCTEAAIRAPGMDCGGIYLVDENSGDLDLKFHRGLPPSFIKSVSHYDANSENTRLVKAGNSIYTRHQELGVHLDEYELRENLQAMAVLPISYKGRVIACLNISSHIHNEVSDYARLVLETVASQIGSAIARSKAEEALRESEENFRSIVETAYEGILVTDAQNKIVFPNQRMAEMLGYTEDEMKGKSIFSFMDKEWKTIAEANLKNRSPGIMEKRDFKFRCKDGTELWAIMTTNPYFDSKGRYKGSLEMVTDITKRKRVEEALRENETRYRELSDSITDIFFAMDKDLKYTYWNKASEKLTGIPAKNAVGKSILEIFPDDEQTKKAVKIYQEVLKKHQPHTFVNEYYLRRKNFVFEISAYPSKDGLSVFVKDITERKKAEEALQASEAFNFALFQYNPMEIIVVDHAGKIIKTNLARRKSGDRWPNIGDVMYKDYAAKHEIDMFSELMESIRLKKKKDFPELKYGNKYLSIIISPFPMGAIIISQDITKLKSAERQIMASLREKEILLQEIHHRVKNNMQVISSILNLQSRSIKNKKALELFKSSQDRIRSMALIHERLYQSKDFTKVDFSRYVQSLTGYLFNSYGISSEAVRLSMDIKDISLGINTAIPCGLIINELVSNSLKHAFPERKKGGIKIAMLPLNENEIELTVSDNGIGMPEDVDIRHTKSLGLHLVTILAEDQLQGEIKLDRIKGTAYKIRLKVKK
jgi:PAS domain S-box-containing protein